MWCSNINERCDLRNEEGIKYVCCVCMYVCTLYTPDTSTEFIVLHLPLLNLDPFVAFHYPSIHALVHRWVGVCVCVCLCVCVCVCVCMCVCAVP